ncbi:Uncharacterised protein [Clostridium tetani]|nr:hypothetical protein LA33_03265 [Clostridium tetani ATCC 9441]SUY66786.1 Uncharacterised protein [Clostridium tetani]
MQLPLFLRDEAKVIVQIYKLRGRLSNLIYNMEKVLLVDRLENYIFLKNKSFSSKHDCFISSLGTWYLVLLNTMICLLMGKETFKFYLHIVSRCCIRYSIIK